MTTNRMTVTVRETDSWMVKALAKQVHTMKWTGRAPGVIVQNKRIGLNEQMNKATKTLVEAFSKALHGTERTVI